MSYIEKNLSKDEEILLRTKISKCLSLTSTIFWAFTSFIILFFSAVDNETSIKSVFIITFTITFIIALYVWIGFITTEMVITNKRAIRKYGIIAKNTNEVRLEKIESVNVDKGILGSLLGYGTISFSGTGGKDIKFKGIPNPERFRVNIEEVLEKYGK